MKLGMTFIICGIGLLLLALFFFIELVIPFEFEGTAPSNASILGKAIASLFIGLYFVPRGISMRRKAKLQQERLIAEAKQRKEVEKEGK